jgi:phenylpyruvate tautomerase PptA (4-oxalocrotonate tautomerase family)
MPTVLIEVRRQYPPAEATALIDAVHAALMEAFKLPAWDKDVRLVEYEPHRFACSPRLPDPDRFVHIAIDCFAGRSVAAKRELYRAIVANLEPLGIPSLCVKVLLRESAPENWGIRGGQAACDIDVGFNINV